MYLEIEQNQSKKENNKIKFQKKRKWFRGKHKERQNST